MKIYLSHDYNGKLTNEIFLAAGEQDVTVDIGQRLIEHGIATAVIEEEPQPVTPAPIPEKIVKHDKRGKR